MSVNIRAATLKILSSAQITLTNVFDGYTIDLSNSNHSIMCDMNGEPLPGEIGSNGKAICTVTVSQGSAFTAVNSTPGNKQYSITISEVQGCTANIKNNNTFYINTLTTSLTGKVVVSINIENKITVKKEMTFVRILNESDFIIDGKFIYGTEYWEGQNHSALSSTNIKIIKSNNAVYGSNILEIRNTNWVYSKRSIDIEKDKIYRIKFRARQTQDPLSGGKQVYIGYTPYDANGNKVSNTHASGNEYLFTSNLNSNVWNDLEFYFSTKARNAIVDINGNTVFKAVSKLPDNTAKIVPVFIANFDNGNGILEVDGYIYEDATEEYSVKKLKYKTSKLKTNVDNINMSVSSIKTITDMSVNPMTLQAKVNYSSYSDENIGEIYLHGLNDNRKPDDVDGKCKWNNEDITLPKTMYNPNGKVPDGIIIYIVRDISVNKWYSIWKDVEDSKWKKIDAEVTSTMTPSNVNWDENNHIVVGYYIIKKTNPKDNEAPILMAQLFNGALNYKQATTMSLTSSTSQIELIEDNIELKVQKNEVIASINLYTQESIDGTATSGIKIAGDKVDLEGQVTFSSLADNSVEGSIKDVFTSDTNTNKTVINGGMIKTNTILGNDLNLKGNLTVTKEENGNTKNTFAIKDNGDIEIDGILKSSNFSEINNTGYRINTDGTAILNQAIIKGDVILPSAGMTNFGGQIGNSNLAVNSYIRSKTTWKNIVNETFDNNTVYVPEGAVVNDTLAVSYKVKYANIVKSQDDAYICMQGSGDVTAWSAGAWNGGPILTKDSRFEWGEGKSGEFEIKYTFKLNADYLRNTKWNVGLRADYIVSGELYITEFKVEKGNTHTPWCPYISEQSNHVRIWAGATYENRNNAKFRVYDNGDVYATNGQFSGTLYGDLENKGIHIDNGTLKINDTVAALNDDGTVMMLSPKAETTSLLLSKEKVLLNTDVIFGDTSNQKIFYSNNNEKLTFNKATLEIRGTDNVVSLSKNGLWTDAFKIESNYENSNTFFVQGFTAYPGVTNTVLIGHGGNKGSEPYGDICFRRYNYNEDLDVSLMGNLKIRKSIKGLKHSIEMRSIENEGWGFFVI